ncbi:hypothetical protein EJD97_018851 [Solanum chilense]|uniref:Gag-pol polyprotein n=1 Tax=Solanum chilense TaxID=4083 RepID=A0A6N2B3Q6_SOLCI|nr:hypothetical protein EJD97_018851 [Solanum chilense]
MNTNRNVVRRVEEEAAGGNQTPPLAPAARIQVSVKPARFTDSEVREALLHMAQAINTEAQAVTAQATKEGDPRENLHASTMASRLRDFTRMNPPIYNGSKTKEDPQEFVDEVHKIVCAMGVDKDAKDELTAYQLKDVAQVWYRIRADGRA